MTQLWLPGAERVSGPHHEGGEMVGGGVSLATHHITTGGSYEFLKGYLVKMGFEPTLLADPVSGKIAQFLPANASGYALMHTTVETNRYGKHHIQIEWMWNTMSNLSIDKAPKFDEVWKRIHAFCKENGVPDVWPFGSPMSSSRSITSWRKGGHRGHRNAPGNDHSDSLPVTKAVAFEIVGQKVTAPTPVPAPAPGRLSEDGDFGPATCRRLEQELTQHKVLAARFDDGSFTLPSRKALQTYLHGHGFYSGAIDGDLGPKSDTGLQKYLNHRGFKCAVDGDWGHGTTTALQKVLNADKF